MLSNDEMSPQMIAEPSTILRGLVGSSVHGLVLSGTDDRDEMGVCVEARRYVVGFGKFEQWVYRSAADREGDMGARSQAGELDLTIYSLRKWTRLALQGTQPSCCCCFCPTTHSCFALVLGNNYRGLRLPLPQGTLGGGSSVIWKRSGSGS